VVVLKRSFFKVYFVDYSFNMEANFSAFRHCSGSLDFLFSSTDIHHVHEFFGCSQF